ncbi:hypothetical protein [Streptomyces sp. NPDC048111]|uniref:hypothetical protein n=1 Tax=Streptomyces sp. NPDC048111 TaxID=3365500 RepID=UPI00371D8E55
MRLRPALVATAVATALSAPFAAVAAADDGRLPPGRHDLAPRKPVVAAAPVAPPAPSKLPLCAGTGSAFPLDTRIHGGPAEYRAGDGPQDWYLDLTNTSHETCEGIHPVLVLVDRDRTLKNTRLTMDFEDPATGRRHPVTFVSTDEDEHIGVFDDGFPGFAIGPGKTLTVPVRLGFTADAVPDLITANAAIVQRRGSDGQWVGESGDYRFEIVPEDDLLGRLDSELAATGRAGALTGLALTAAVLLLGGAGLVVMVRGARGRRR